MIRMRLIILLLSGGLILSAEDEGVLKQRIQARSAAVVALLTSGVLREGNDGKLKPVGQLDIQQSQLMREENRDRDAIFQMIAGKSNLSLDEVGKMYAKKAQPKFPPPPPSAQSRPNLGSCGLAPAKPPDVQRVLMYLKQGMGYASQGRYELALNEFEQIRKVDPNFLAMHQNIAAAQLKLKQFPEAEQHLQEELKLIACFEKSTDAELTDFAYMLEVDRAAANPGAARVKEMRARMKQARNAAHYNLACIRSHDGNTELALKELADAIDGGFRDAAAMKKDPDLAGVRSAPGFQKLLSAVAKPVNSQ